MLVSRKKFDNAWWVKFIWEKEFEIHYKADECYCD